MAILVRARRRRRKDYLDRFFLSGAWVNTEAAKLLEAFVDELWRNTLLASLAIFVDDFSFFAITRSFLMDSSIYNGTIRTNNFL